MRSSPSPASRIHRGSNGSTLSPPGLASRSPDPPLLDEPYVVSSPAACTAAPRSDRTTRRGRIPDQPGRGQVAASCRPAITTSPAETAWPPPPPRPEPDRPPPPVAYSQGEQVRPPPPATSSQSDRVQPPPLAASSQAGFAG